MEDITLEQVELDLPKLGKVIVKELTFGQRLEVEKKFLADETPVAILYICLCTYNPDGTAKYTFDDALKVAQLPNRVINPLMKAVLKINWIGEEEQAEIKKNS